MASAFSVSIFCISSFFTLASDEFRQGHHTLPHFHPHPHSNPLSHTLTHTYGTHFWRMQPAAYDDFLITCSPRTGGLHQPNRFFRFFCRLFLFLYLSNTCSWLFCRNPIPREAAFGDSQSCICCNWRTLLSRPPSGAVQKGRSGELAVRRERRLDSICSA